MNRHFFRTAMLFSLILFILLTLMSLLNSALTMLMYRLGFLDEGTSPFFVLVPAVISIIAGVTGFSIIGKRPVRAIEEISRATKSVAEGDFSVQLKQTLPLEEFEEMTNNFNTMTRQLASTEMLRNDFIANVSHEFKTPLAAIEGYAMLLQRKGLSEEKREEYVARILYGTKRLSALTGNILLLSRLENQETGLERERFCLDEQLREVILLFEEQWTQKKLELDIELDVADYNGNRELLAQVWQNILSNAIKFAPECGRVGVYLTSNADGIVVTVSDNGPGMDEQAAKRVFEKFYRADTSRAYGGNGLGLTLAKRIVELHGGTIAVRTAPNKGATFTVKLPVISG